MDSGNNNAGTRHIPLLQPRALWRCRHGGLLHRCSHLRIPCVEVWQEEKPEGHANAYHSLPHQVDIAHHNILFCGNGSHILCADKLHRLHSAFARQFYQRIELRGTMGACQKIHRAMDCMDNSRRGFVLPLYQQGDTFQSRALRTLRSDSRFGISEMEENDGGKHLTNSLLRISFPRYRI